MSKDTILKVSAVILILFFWWFGYGVEVRKVASCTGEVKRYVVAEFIETISKTSMDMDGNISTDLETNYREETVSNIYVVYTKNGVVDSDYPFNVIGGIGVPQYPKIILDYSREPNFDRNRKKHISSYRVWFNDGDFFTGPVSIHKSCMDNLGKVIPVKTWYGIKYSSNFVG